jgi:hypothetical protein
VKNRRRLVVAPGASSLLASFGSWAQTPGKVWRVGFLTLRGRPDSFDANVFGAFRAGMCELGYIKGAKPADLPVEQPAKFEVVINLTTAKALGLAIPASLLLRADEVIQ